MEKVSVKSAKKDYTAKPVRTSLKKALKKKDPSVFDTTVKMIEDIKTSMETSKVATSRRSKVKKSSDNFVTLNDYFKVPTGTYNILKRNMEKGISTMLLGPTGVGKTELVSNLAQSLGLPLTIFDMGTMSDPIMSLVGSHTIQIKDGQTSSSFIKSRFSQVIQQPGVVLLDEISRSSPTANNLLFPCLDFRKELAMEYCFEDSTPIKVHPQCVFVATANIGSQYSGTSKLDRALLDRFMLMEIDPLDKTQIIDTMQAQYPEVSDIALNKIVDCYEEINKAHDNYTISFNLSIRHLKMIIELVKDGFTIYDGFYTICKGIGSKDGLKVLESILTKVK